MKITRIFLTLVLLLGISSGFNSGFSAAPDSAPGGFDIEKVRQALEPANGSGIGQASAPVKPPSMKALAFRTLVSLAIVLLLLAGLLYVFRRIAFRGRSGVTRSGILDVLETSSIMPGKSLTLVRISDRVLLLGVTQEGISSLAQFEGDKALEIIQATDKGNLPRSLSQFSEHLNQFIDKFRSKGEPPVAR